MPSHTHNTFSTNQSTQGSYNGFRLHSPYGLYGYNFSTSPRLATSPEKAAATQSSFLGSSPSGTLTDRQVLSTVDSLHMLSSSQQNLFDSRTLGLTSSTSQVTAHMAWPASQKLCRTLNSAVSFEYKLVLGLVNSIIYNLLEIHHSRKRVERRTYYNENVKNWEKSAISFMFCVNDSWRSHWGYF